MTPSRFFRAFKPELLSVDLPAGVIGQIKGIAVVYGVLDDHGTTFKRGCFDRTQQERVAAGKVRLYWDHGKAFETGVYDSDLHIGTVRSLQDVQLPDGKWAAEITADLFDTPKGREAKQYLESVLATNGETGLSVGTLHKHIKSHTVRMDGDLVDEITEFPMREISITSMQSVPDSGVLAVRASDRPSLEAALDVLLRSLPREVIEARVTALLGGNTPPVDSNVVAKTTSDAPATVESPTETLVPPVTVYASMEDRMMAFRRSYAQPTG